ncbi:phospholipase A [Lysobacter solisilvae (ex Woo and Kim 2020)]|uniref:Phospholipase A1 n=1 Tax=Agrilutibacter terrestris TaxID=2865112 RepID=A0A7H0FY45_9GAMM|nr:phospholipase A [Lysobacter terrestris]QNP40961.1 phospholipase A [Lysobacter terrestris]
MRAALATALLAAAAPALAADAGDSTPIPEACVAITVDADRLACYDAAMKRGKSDTLAADQAASAARATKEVIQQYEHLERQTLPPKERTRRVVSDLFRKESGSVFDERIANAGKGSLLDSRWELAKDSKLGTFNFRAYKPVYLLPAFWSSNPNELPTSSNPSRVPPQRQALNKVEAKFQLSFKTKIAENLFGDNGDLWAAYTQSSRWQVYNADQSRPFRETNYEPEVLLAFRNNYSLGGWRGRMFAVGVNHQSNGRADPISRSWNRVVANIGLDREDWAVMIRPWWRIPDGRNEDENPGIEDYIGRGDITLVHRRNDHELALMARHSLRTGDASHGALQFDWGFPINRTLRGHVQVFDGYGESLIDYNHRAWYLGVGVSLLEWY